MSNSMIWSKTFWGYICVGRCEHYRVTDVFRNQNWDKIESTHTHTQCSCIDISADQNVLFWPHIHSDVIVVWNHNFPMILWTGLNLSIYQLTPVCLILTVLQTTHKLIYNYKQHSFKMNHYQRSKWVSDGPVGGSDSRWNDPAVSFNLPPPQLPKVSSAVMRHQITARRH